MQFKDFKSLKTSNDHTYSYYASPASDGAPTLVLLHGFPDTAITCYGQQIPHFQKLGFGIIAPNILGYPGTSMPTERYTYVGSQIATSIISILDEEKANNVVAIGHDWGAIIASRLALLAPERVKAVVLTSVGAPNPEGDKYNVDKMKALAQQAIGVPMPGYIEAMTAEAEGAGLLRDYEAKESFRTLVYPEDGEIWKTDLLPEGKCKEWITERKKGPLAPWVTEQDKEQFHTLNFATVTQYYASMVHNDMFEDIRCHDALQQLIQPPTLLLLASRDRACPPFFFNQPDGLRATYADVELKEIDCGHWMVREKEQEWRDSVQAFLKVKGLC